MVLPADKGKLTVVMNRSEYDDKMVRMLSDTSTYRQLDKDPTSTQEKSMNSKLFSLRRVDKLSNVLYTRLRSSAGLIPRVYGLPKVHKEGVPLRPIVSFVSSPTYQLSKYLCTLLSPLVGNSDATVMNSSEFASFVCGEVVEDDEVFVSFDVVSLFTRVPIGLAVSVARRLLENDDTLAERTLLSVDDVIDLLEFCLGATFMTFRGKIFRQVHGTAMGSPVSVVVANLVMEDVEQRALHTFAHPPRVWKRYVDDILCIIGEEHIESFHQHLNAIEL